MKKIFSLSLITYLLLLSVTFLPRPAYAQAPDAWKNLLGDRCVKTENGVEVATIQGFECLMINVLRIITPLVGLVMFFTLVAGAFKYLTAGGDQKKSQQAQKTITFAIIGIVVFVGIWFVLKLIQTITGVDVTQFKIPGP